MLENHGNLAAQGPSILGRHGINTGHRHLARIGLRQPVHAAQQGGLARSGLTQHNQKLTGFCIHVHTAQDIIGAITFVQATQTDHFMLRRSRFSTLAVSRTTL